MSITVLLESFACDPDEFYVAIGAAVAEREVPDATCNPWTVARGRKLLSGPTESVSALKVTDGTVETQVLAYRYGRDTIVTTEHEFCNPDKVAVDRSKDKFTELDELRATAFSSLVDRCVKSVISEKLEAAGAAVPESLKAEDVFLTFPSE